MCPMALKYIKKNDSLKQSGKFLTYFSIIDRISTLKISKIKIIQLANDLIGIKKHYAPK